MTSCKKTKRKRFVKREKKKDIYCQKKHTKATYKKI